MSWKDRFKLIPSVYLILVYDDGQVLLLRRQNTGFKDGELGLPAGHMDGEEELMQAMCREAKEEIGLDLDPENLILAHTMHRRQSDHERMDFFIMCRKWTGSELNCEPEKCSELIWVSLDDLPEDLIDYYKQVFEHIRQGSVYSSFGWK